MQRAGAAEEPQCARASRTHASTESGVQIGTGLSVPRRVGWYAPRAEKPRTRRCLRGRPTPCALESHSTHNLAAAYLFCLFCSERTRLTDPEGPRRARQVPAVERSRATLLRGPRSRRGRNAKAILNGKQRGEGSWRSHFQARSNDLIRFSLICSLPRLCPDHRPRCAQPFDSRELGARRPRIWRPLRGCKRGTVTPD